ncbi:glycoside hydrolase domain-containing protein [Pararcticibacter amylolyticus]|uniref:Alpha-mannosidase n=1 Tax=Pararcticibacter amylolyticus TaxID=2173175 RepID=A0A2U2PA07_9SPHI|nr:glycoside hydrolase domain-containing protein [Pararcticibacter amylolyticus]PWG78236.1 alpha-mannosidase [Pararcticibacter amylolyticus]
MTKTNNIKGIALFQVLCLFFILPAVLKGQSKSAASGPDVTGLVNVFLGTSGDHGQMSPAASSPFSMLSIGPQTYPHTHTGYEYNAKKFLGFTHNRFEGVGCTGSGGIILIRPFAGSDPSGELIKASQSASPGYYSVSFSNGIQAEFSVIGKSGMHRYKFPSGEKGFSIDLSHSLSNSFVNEEHQAAGNILSGWIDSKTTCHAGKYRTYYYIRFGEGTSLSDGSAHKLSARIDAGQTGTEIRIALSSVSVEYAKASLYADSFDALKAQSSADWNSLLQTIRVKGDKEEEKLFYSLLYRTVQSPYLISEADGKYKGTNGALLQSRDQRYNGWAVWDNYRTQLPLLSIAWPGRYKDISASLASLYQFGKKDYATQNEPSNTVRTEHSIVVLLDSYRKGYQIDFNKIIESLIREVDQLDFSRPDKALESSYDTWALSEILAILKKKDLSDKYKQKALQYKEYWNKDFKDITRPDVDRMQARGLYQGTIWQYRWFVPFDVKGLIELTGGAEPYKKQLDQFFQNDYYNHANEPDLQVPLMYNASSEPWKSQALMYQLSADTVVQYYFNDNSRGIDPFVDRIYKNQPQAYVRTMDDDAGAMSAWYVFAACGFSPACVGWPVYYLNVPLFQSVEFRWPGKKSFSIRVENQSPKNRYIQKVTLNGKELSRNYITHQEIMAGGTMVIVASDKPDGTWIKEKWVSAFGE